MKYGIDCGHCLTGFDTGASGNGYREEILTREIGKSVISKLKALGYEVIDCTCDEAKSIQDSLSSRYTKGNINNVDMFVAIHLNAFNKKAHGVEIYTYAAKEIKEAKNILNNIVNLGYTNRGIKDGKGLAVIRNTKAISMLIECCFIDNVEDMKKFNADKMSDAIVLGLTGKSVFKSDPVIKEVSKVNYILEFQRWYNTTTKTSKPLVEDGIMGTNTENAYQTLGKLIGGTY